MRPSILTVVPKWFRMRIRNPSHGIQLEGEKQIGRNEETSSLTFTTLPKIKKGYSHPQGPINNLTHIL